MERPATWSVVPQTWFILHSDIILLLLLLLYLMCEGDMVMCAV